jgi:hypothetical protein
MRDATIPSKAVLDERWQKSLAMFEMWTQIWRDNPSVLAKAGKKVRELMMPLDAVQQSKFLNEPHQ